MTAKRDLKKRVRERQAKTGESYTTAREHVLAGREAPEPEPAREPMSVLELVDLTPAAERLGLRCRASIFPDLAKRVDGATVLARLRAALLATEGDPATALLRGVLLRGEPPPPVTMLSGEFLEETRRFVKRVRAGLGGPSKGGRMLALQVDGKQGSEMVICGLWPAPPPHLKVDRPPALLLCRPDSLYAGDAFQFQVVLVP